MSDLPEPKIYVADLAAYNAGHLRGEWLRLSNYENAEHLRHAIGCLLEKWDRNLLSGMTGPVEEYRIDDFEGIPSALIPRHGGIDTENVMAYVRLCDLEDTGAAKAFIEAEFHRETPPEEWPRAFQERYLGTFSSLEEWARRHLESTGFFSGVPEAMARYFDFEAYARDARLGGDVVLVDFGIDTKHVFLGH
ncbi:antirestriction protein [Salinibacter ruber]|uniref:antirestriction protein ArdA n=1 Tax=Salinibacter ruber TaxID=146919 RepID=UPI0021680ED5|nr:antirestriction protein ArdA [Salinibacter ruber]MCS3668864.1 antirestriction protein [Salinibacter ruber]